MTWPRNPDRHHVTKNRAWCLCGAWCYEQIPCGCCLREMAKESPCPHCDGTGAAKPAVIPDLKSRELIEAIAERFGLCRPEDQHPHGDYRHDHGHTDCWLLGQAIKRIEAQS